jgi:rubrerythrin
VQSTELKSIIRELIQIELEAMHYYRRASLFMQDEGAIFNFNLLADEEQEHARSFYDIYPGTDLPPFDRMLDLDRDHEPLVASSEAELLAGFDERQALQLALKLEQEVEKSLGKMAAKVTEPDTQAVIEKNLESTLNHYEMIAADFARLYSDDLPQPA